MCAFATPPLAPQFAALVGAFRDETMYCAAAAGASDCLHRNAMALKGAINQPN
jgi:hypothetical protein